MNYEEEQFNAQNDFLNYKILEVGDQVVVAFDYIFADQARNVLSQMYSTLSARFGGIDVSVFHFGKVGLLAPSLDIGHICVVTGSIDEEDIQQGDLRLSPIHNQLDPQRDREIAKEFAELVEEPIHYGTTVNTISVLRQTKQALEQDLKAGGDFLDMEWSAMAGLDHGRRSCYPHLGQIRYFFAGIGSDNPMKGATLGNTAYPRETERKVAEAFLELIRRDYL